MSTIDRRSLSELLSSRFSTDELRQLVFDLNLDWESVVGNQGTKLSQVFNLIEYYERHQQIDQLITAVAMQRPDVLTADTVYALPAALPRPAAPPSNWPSRIPGHWRWAVGVIALGLILAFAVSQSLIRLPGGAINLPASRGSDQPPANAQDYLNRGYAFYNQNAYDQAIADFTQVLRLQPYSSDAYHGLGLAYESKGDYAQALANFTRAIEIQSNPDFYLDRGSLYANHGDLDAAINDFTRAIEVQSGYAQAYLYRGLAYKQQQQRDKAIADFEKVVALDNPDLRQPAEDQLHALATPSTK